MDSVERVRCVLAGRWPDRLPYSFWYHFSPDKARGRPAALAHQEHALRHGLDFLKVMNDHGYPWHESIILSSAPQLRRIEEVDPRDGPFGEQLTVLRQLRKNLPIPLVTTIFSPWTVLRSLCERWPMEHFPPDLSAVQKAPDQILSSLLRTDEEGFKQALARIGRSLAAFAAECIEAGADGIFLSVREDWVDSQLNPPGTYDRFAAPADLLVMEAAGTAWFNILHVCGRPRKLSRFAGYPNAHVLNWADRAAGPSIAEALRSLDTVVAGGLDNLRTLPNGTPQDCEREALDAVHQAGQRPIFITPGCTYDAGQVPEQNLEAVARAVRVGDSSVRPPLQGGGPLD